MSQARSCIPKFLSIRALLVSLAAIAILTAAPAAASALPSPTLFMTTGGTGSSLVTAPPSELWRLDPNTGAATSVGNTGYAISALAQDPTTGALYAASNNRSPIAPNTLLRLDPVTGAATPIGSFGEFQIPDMSFDSSGRLVAWAETD